MHANTHPSTRYQQQNSAHVADMAITPWDAFHSQKSVSVSVGECLCSDPTPESGAVVLLVILIMIYSTTQSKVKSRLNLAY